LLLALKEMAVVLAELQQMAVKAILFLLAQ
jgi:hypothetical protein